jgi:hypothetical protein
LTELEVLVLEVALDHLEDDHNRAIRLEELHHSIDWIPVEVIGATLAQLAQIGYVEYVAPIVPECGAIVGRPSSAAIERAVAL